MARSIVFLVLVLALVAVAANIQQVAAQCEDQYIGSWGCISCCGGMHMAPDMFNHESGDTCSCVPYY